MTLTAKEMKAAEKAAFERGISYLQMMENAGRQAFELLLSRRPDIKTAAVFCGSGGCGRHCLRERKGEPGCGGSAAMAA